MSPNMAISQLTPAHSTSSSLIILRPFSLRLNVQEPTSPISLSHWISVDRYMKLVLFSLLTADKHRTEVEGNSPGEL